MPVDGPIQNYGPAQDQPGWTSRPILARCLRITVLLLPIVASFAVTWTASAYFPPSELGVNVVLWWVGVLIVATLTMFGIERIARRGLPLVALLRMNLVFPEEAPSRFGTALRTGTTKQLERRVEEMRLLGLHDSDEVTYGQQMLELVAALNAHDRLTRGHCERVRAYTDLIIEEMKIPDDEANMLRWSALLHDVGKIMVPSSILNKEGRPDDDEWEILKAHTWQGQEMVKPIATWLGDWSRAVGEHHERWDGDGYPNGYAANEIHLGARIVAVADAFDVMTSSRSYKKPMPTEAARDEVARCAGTQFDPEVVRAFLNIGIGRLRLAIGPLTWLANIPSAGQIPVAPIATPITNVVASAIGATAAVITGGAGGLLLPEDTAPVVPEPAVAFVDEEPVAISIPPTMTTGVPITIPVVEITVPAPTTTTTTTTSAPPTTSAPTTSTVAPTPTVTSAPTTTAVPSPVGNNSSLTIGEDTPTAVSLSGVSGSGSPTFSIVVQPRHGSLTLVSTANAGAVAGEEIWTYTPDPDFDGTDSFVYQVCDDRGICDTATVEFVVTPVEDIPVAKPDAINTSEDTAKVISPSDLLANDTDGDPGDILTLDSYTQPRNGTISTSFSGDLLYTPNKDVNGTDTFTYLITDDAGNVSVPATVTIAIRPKNDPPIPQDDAGFTATEGQPLTIAVADLLANDVDIDSDNLTIATVDDTATEGTATLNPAATLVTFVGSPTFAGTTKFSYEVCDTEGKCVSPVAVSVTVTNLNDPPIASADTLAALPEDSTTLFTGADLLANDTDDDLPYGDILTVTTNTSSTNNGSIVSGLGGFSYTPAANFNGTDTFSYKVCDLALACDTATVTIVVTAIPDAPIASDDIRSAEVDSVTSLTGLIANDFDNDVGDTLTMTSVSGTINGGSVSIDTAGNIVYTAPPLFSGIDEFTYQVADQTGRLSNAATVFVTVDNTVNDPPTSRPDTFSTAAETAVALTFADIVSNDSDPDLPYGDGYSLSIVAGPITGTLVSDLAAAQFVYTPQVGFTGTETFTYQYCDDAGSCDGPTKISVVVTRTNEAPVANADTLSVDVDSAHDLTNQILSNDTDPDIPSYGQTLVITAVDSPTDPNNTASVAGGALNFVTSNFVGTETLSYQVCDDGAPVLCSTGTITITVNNPNDAPVAVDDLAGITVDVLDTNKLLPNLLDNDVDADLPYGDILSIANVDSNSAEGGAVSVIGGVVAYTPPANFVGRDTFTYAVSDASGRVSANRALVAIDVVNSTNDPPVAGDDSFTTHPDWESPQNQKLTIAFADYSANDTDADTNQGGEVLTFTLVDFATPNLGVVTQAGPNADIVYQPIGTYHGVETFRYKVCDDDLECSTGTIEINLLDVNNPPLVDVADPHSPATPFTGAEDTTWATISPTVTDALDAQTGDSHTWSIATGTLPDGLSIDPATGAISGRPTAGSRGTYTVAIRATDDSTAIGGALFDDQVITIEIADWEKSELAGKVLISEVLYNETSGTFESAIIDYMNGNGIKDAGRLDEFVEITNNSGGPIALSDLRLTDFNAKEVQRDSTKITYSTGYLTYSSHFDLTVNGTAVLDDGETVTFWLNAPQVSRVTIFETDTSNVLAEFDKDLVSLAGTGHPQVRAGSGVTVLDNAADDVWLLDSDGRIIDIVAWDDQSGTSESLSPMPTEFFDWSVTDTLEFSNAPAGDSKSIADYGTHPMYSFSDPTCWETTAVGKADCSGAGAPDTEDTAGTGSSSPGAINIAGGP